ncbi:MAG: hypothetical protein IT162_11050 [Bryobacterales bacterium]|nr:hypothetical protein [Bryobacterales bacterium]
MLTRFSSNLRDCRLEAEIMDESGAIVAFIYEDFAGWHVELTGATEIDAVLVESTKAVLTRYVNRTGANPPAGLTAQGLALWLMTKDDGTAMGRKP